MTYEELKKAYEESMQKCSELEKEIEDKDLRIEHLTELLIKRNKMLFGQKSEKGKIYMRRTVITGWNGSKRSGRAV